MTTKPYFKLVVAIAIIAVFSVLQWQFNLIPIRASKESSIPTAVELPTSAPTVAHVDVSQGTLPSTTPSTVNGSSVRANIWAWNAQMGLIFANGGPKTTKDSLMEKHGVRLTLVRQDDTDKSKAEQIKFAQKLANGDPNPGEGTHFVIIMGDQSAGYIAGVNKALERLGPEYRAEVVGAVGWSGNSVSGEDCFMGPEDWKTDPSKMRGGLVAGAIREGDWNIAMNFLQNNGVKNNPDETTWDPDALNWVNTDYIKAAELYNNSYCEDRKVVHEGKISSEAKRHVCVQGVVTWTPGDVNIAKKRGGLVKLLSTKENAFQMPAVVIGIHKWNNDHSKVVQGFLSAAFEGADQVRSYEPALQRAGKASYAVYAEESAAYWVRYYRGAVERDRTGVPIALGGSRVANLGDNLVLFGLADGSGDASSSMFRATYEGFGNIAKQQYPKLVPSFPATNEAVNLSFLQAIAGSATKESKPEAVSYEESSAPISDVVGKRDWTINFDTGRSTPTADGLRTLADLYDRLSINKLNIQLEGHTDNTGSGSANVALSEARAEAVKSYLTGKAPALFPSARIATLGYGDSKPLMSNATAEGRATNRRVTVTIGNR